MLDQYIGKERERMTAQPSVRDLVGTLQYQLREQRTASDGETMRAISNTAAGLLGFVNAEELDAEIAYREIEKAFILDHSAAKATILAKATAEYARWRRAENVHEELKAIKTATDNALRSLSFEQHAMRGQ
jgi:hypothetical protein